MKLSDKLKRYILHPENFILYLNRYKLLQKLISDKCLLKCLYRARMGKKLNLKDPRTYNEKLQWLKLYDRKPIYTKMVDKYEVKEYVAEKIGAEYIIPTLGVWDRFEEIDFEKLPEQFVLKCTHDSGGLVICKNKNCFDYEAAKRKINASLKRNYYWSTREWPYKNVKKRIIAETYMEDTKTGELPDYKFFAFDGKVKAMFIATERQSVDETKFDFFDENFNHLPFTNGHPNAEKMPEKPTCFEEMKTLSEKLSVGIPQVRVDFYEVNGKVYFGELTFFHWGGTMPFEPEEWDDKFGREITLSKE